MSVPAVPALNIASIVTRIQGLVQQPYSYKGYEGSREAVAGPVTFPQLIANAFSTVQAWANILAGQVSSLAKQVATITTSGSVTLTVTNLIVTVDEVGNKLNFKVQYSNGTTKNGSVNLI